MRAYTGKMNKWMAVLLLSLFAVGSARAQGNSVTVEVSLDQEQFLPQEEIKVAVRITNFSGQPLELGKDNTWLSFTVQSLEKRLLDKYGDPEVAGVFTLNSSMTATKRANITPFYNLQTPGRYEVSVRVRIPQWNVEVSSRPATFDIVRGAKLREVQFGVPAGEGDRERAPEVRKYILQQAEYRKEMKLYIRLADATESKTLKLFPISRMVSFARPEAQLDKFSNLHVLHQSGQNSFSYCTMNPYGQILTLNRYDFLGDSRPRLSADENGRIIVRGGSRVMTENDVPPPENFADSNGK